MDKSVLEVFHKFDSDGSGAISRDELGEVLKSLQEEPWEDDQIDALLTAADASGDGELQVEEFVKWVFATDQEISETVKGTYTIKVSGCSREEFNGDYVQQEGEFYYRRPIFFCAEQEKYLFYHGKREQWQIFGRTGSKASCRLKTTRSVTVPGEGMTWAVWKAKKDSGKKTFLREPSMTVVADVGKKPSAEELLRKAEDCVKFDEIYFKKVDGQVLGDRAVYRQKKGEDWADMYLFYEGPETRWKRGTEPKIGEPSLNVSRVTDVPSPELAIWMDEMFGGRIDVIAVDTDGLPNTVHKGLKLNRSIPEGWHDPEFEHNKASIGTKASKNMGSAAWHRALALHPAPVLFADVAPSDVCQGRVGNCWLVAAISAVAEFPKYLKGSVFITKKVSKEGKYIVKLYDGRKFSWVGIEVDDYLPCTSWGGDTPSLLFGKISEGKLCWPILEKAFAKLYGSYSQLSGGYQWVAWHHLTGCKEFFMFTHKYGVAVRWVVATSAGIPVYSDKRRSKKLGVLAEGAHFHEVQRIGSWIRYKKADGDGPDSGWLSYYMSGVRVATRDPVSAVSFSTFKGTIDPRYVTECVGGDEGSPGKGQSCCVSYSWCESSNAEQMWHRLMNYDKGNYLMACTATYCKQETDCGMVHKHAYSLLHAVEIGGFRLVACRNPWGTDAEWNGPWSDRSAEWRAHKDIADALKVDFQTDGIFWMDYEDWQFIFGQVRVMNCQMPSTRGAFKNTFVDTDEDGDGDDTVIIHDEEDDEDYYGQIVGCWGLGPWHQPTKMEEGIPINPGQSKVTFKNVPAYLNGYTYFGLKEYERPDNWMIEYYPPVKIYIWLMVDNTNSLDLVMLQPSQGWTQEPADGFQTSDGYDLMVLSKVFHEGKYTGLRSTSNFVGGAIGAQPPPKLPKSPDSGDDVVEAAVGEPISMGTVTECTGLDIEWNAGELMTEGTLVNPGDRDYVFENVPEFLAGGCYIGTRTWPQAGTWTIKFQAPVKLYVWIEQGQYNAGVDDALSGDGWNKEEPGDFQRRGKNGVNPLGLWSRFFPEGDSYSIETTSLMVGGVISKAPETD
ncbi:unnamed protein product [Durusdinium trenchii]|uniref:Calpain-11 (Calcium-activated neutral proteinase 11) (CANP 11) n=2 Tax=Durusdinium trenchii TaxID=1381693 RepID=A0ABP0RSL2_9DINO